MDKKQLAKLRAANVLIDIMNNHKERIAELATAKDRRENQKDNTAA